MSDRKCFGCAVRLNVGDHTFKQDNQACLSG